MSSELREFLVGRGVAVSRTTPYNPQGNGQCERYNGIIWRSITLALKSRKLPVTHWERVLTDVLHAIRSLLCTATNCTPHERMFSHQRRSASGHAIPTWLSMPGKVLLKKHVRQSKFDALVDEVDLLDANTQYAHVRFSNGRETTVSVRDLAPPGDAVPVCGDPEDLLQAGSDKTGNLPETDGICTDSPDAQPCGFDASRGSTESRAPLFDVSRAPPLDVSCAPPLDGSENVVSLRRSTRKSRPPDRLNL